MIVDPYGDAARAHIADLVRAADRRRPRCRRPSLVVRVYARIWWASRPRAASWAPALLEPQP